MSNLLRMAKSIRAVATMNQHIALKNPQLFVKLMRVADNYNFHK